MKNPRLAFTLVEVLIVMAVLGILSAILLPALNMIRSKGRQSTCANNMRQTGMAIIQYGAGNNSAIPETSATIVTDSWDRKVIDFDNYGGGIIGTMNYPSLKCPEDSKRPSVTNNRSYFIPATTVSGNNISGLAKPPLGGLQNSRLLAEIASPDTTIILGECWTLSNGTAITQAQGDTTNAVQYGFNSVSTGTNSGYATVYAPRQTGSTTNYYHGKSINFFCASGRVEGMNPQFLINAIAGTDLTAPQWKVDRP